MRTYISPVGRVIIAHTKCADYRQMSTSSDIVDKSKSTQLAYKCNEAVAYLLTSNVIYLFYFIYFTYLFRQSRLRQ